MMSPDHVPAVAAVPLKGVGALEEGAVFNMLQQGSIAFLVEFLHLGDFPEGNGYFPEAFLFGHLGKVLVHGGPFVVFPLGRGIRPGKADCGNSSVGPPGAGHLQKGRLFRQGGV